MLAACTPPSIQTGIVRHKGALSTHVKYLNALSHSISTVIVQNVIHSHFTDKNTEVQGDLAAHSFHSLPSTLCLSQ